METFALVIWFDLYRPKALGNVTSQPDAVFADLSKAECEQMRDAAIDALSKLNKLDAGARVYCTSNWHSR